MIDRGGVIATSAIASFVSIANAWLGAARLTIRQSYQIINNYSAADYLASFAMNRALELSSGANQSMSKYLNECCHMKTLLPVTLLLSNLWIA